MTNSLAMLPAPGVDVRYLKRPSPFPWQCCHSVGKSKGLTMACFCLCFQHWYCHSLLSPPAFLSLICSNITNIIHMQNVDLLNSQQPALPYKPFQAKYLGNCWKADIKLDRTSAKLCSLVWKTPWIGNGLKNANLGTRSLNSECFVWSVCQKTQDWLWEAIVLFVILLRAFFYWC